MTTATVTRFDRADQMRAEADRLTAAVFDEVARLRPLGRASDLSMAMGGRPRRGVLCSVPTGGTYVFAKDRVPGPLDLARWSDMTGRAAQLRADALELAAWSMVDVGCTVGNRVFMRNGERLADAGLLDADEERFLAELRRFWAGIDEDDNRVCGVVQPDGTVARFD